MALDASKVYAPTPDQSTTTGAVAVAPTGTAAPANATAALSNTWDDGGYVSEDGISVTITRSTVVLRDWSKSAVRALLSEFAGTISVNFLQIDQFAAERVFGSGNVTVASGKMKVAIGSELPPIESWCFSMKDGNARIRVYVPRGQITDVNQVDFKPDTGNVIGGTLTTFDDGTGKHIYFMYDDGTTVSG